MIVRRPKRSRISDRVSQCGSPVGKSAPAADSEHPGIAYLAPPSAIQPQSVDWCCPYGVIGRAEDRPHRRMTRLNRQVDAVDAVWLSCHVGTLHGGLGHVPGSWPCAGTPSCSPMRRRWISTTASSVVEVRVGDQTLSTPKSNADFVSSLDDGRPSRAQRLRRPGITQALCKHRVLMQLELVSAAYVRTDVEPLRCRTPEVRTTRLDPWAQESDLPPAVTGFCVERAAPRCRRRTLASPHT